MNDHFIFQGLPYEEDGRTWLAGDIGLRDMPCGWMKTGFLSVNTDLGAGRAFLRSLYEQYADWDVDFGMFAEFSPFYLIFFSLSNENLHVMSVKVTPVNSF